MILAHGKKTTSMNPEDMNQTSSYNTPATDTNSSENKEEYY